MSRVRASETKAELKIKPFLKILGFIYQPKNVYGKPNLYIRKKRLLFLSMVVSGISVQNITKSQLRIKNSGKIKLIRT